MIRSTCVVLVSMAPQELQHYFNAAAMSNFHSERDLSIDCELPETVNDETVGDGAVDFRGRPSVKSKTGNWKASALIFGCEACERVGFNAISSNLVGYLTSVLREDLPVAVRNANNWSGTVRLTPILAAIIADSYLGRFLTIGIFMSVYLLAQVLVATSVTAPSLKPRECQDTWCPAETGTRVAFFYGTLYAMAVGAGGIRACVFPMAGDQFDATDATEAKRKLAAPNWYFIAITTGNLVGVSGLVYAQARLGWSWGYGIPAAVTAIAALAFFAGAPLYRNQRVAPGSTPVTRVAQVLVAAARNWRVPAHDASSSSGFSFLDKAATRPGQEGDPWKQCTAAQVEEVKALVRMVPIWVTNIMFWVVYAQVSTLFLKQGTTLDRRVFAGAFEIPAASMPLFVNLSICVFLPVYDKLVVPLARKVTGENRGLSLLQRIGIGQAVSVVPVAVAALVEVRRLRLVAVAASSPGSSLPMSIFWLLPQYILMGITEVFLSVGQIEFFIDQAPMSMRSLGNAMSCSAMALGNFGSSMLVGIVTKVTSHGIIDGGWIRNDVNESHIDYFYWLLTVLTVVNFSVYLFFAHRYNSNLNTIKTVKATDVVTIASVDKRVHPVSVNVDL